MKCLILRLDELSFKSTRMDDLEGYVKFFIPDLEVLKIPAWDCLPYDRVSPNPAISSQRAFAFSYLA